MSARGIAKKFSKGLPKWSRYTVCVCLKAGDAVFASSVQNWKRGLNMNEFELVGRQFLPFYMIVMFATTSGALITRAALKNVIGQYPDLEMSAYDAAYLSGGDKRVVDAAIRTKLIDAGLILSDGRTAAIRTTCTLLTLAPVVFWGVPKIILGLSRHKPVTFLVVLCAIGLCTAAWFFCQKCIRTSRGDDAVEYLKGQNRSLEYSLAHDRLAQARK